jgi:dipeptidyl aminopeptidase/acylaminoacyl peptidase
LIPAALNKLVENLQRHGIEVEELREDIELEIEACRIDQIARGPTYQKHALVALQATPRKETRRFEAGTILVKTAQPLGNLAAYLLEPQSADGLATWNFLDRDLREGQDFPVVRLLTAVPLNSGRARPLSKDRTLNKPITIEAVLRSDHPPNFTGTPISGLTWLEDGEHYLQRKDGRLYKVHARTGKSQPFFDPAKLAKGLSSLPTIHGATAQSLAGSPLQLNPQRAGAVFEHASDLYFCNLDGTGAVRLTKRPGAKELANFSPDGKFVAFVRGNNLYVVDIATQTERALTTDGSPLVFNGKADWVYFEEIYFRSHQAHWWSPDSSHLFFLRIDDSPVHPFTVVDQISPLQVVETTRYPKAGDPNPLVKIGIVSAGGGPIHWVDLRDYSENSMLLVRAGWTPDSQQVYFYVQDRAQTWLDFCTVSRDGGVPTRLFRETTKAWVDDPGAAKYLKDGSFLLASERTGWKHFYHFAKDGKLIAPVTSGTWEARTLHLVDEEGGWVYFSGTRDSSIAENLYRVKLTTPPAPPRSGEGSKASPFPLREGGRGDRSGGNGLERLTNTSGNHQVSVGPKGRLFIDSWSDHQTPTQVRLYATDGALMRTLDTNPVHAREEYRFGKYELVQIPTPDGFTLEGSILKPANFDPKRRYPVWFMTYAGPHAPTIHDSWGGGRVQDEALAQAGFIVFRCDPRSASGKGACSTWVAYKKLGIPELADIETAICWLNSHSYIDPSRIGMSGHSYGGFMTAFALTHSKLFAAGIAGAPVTDWRNYDTIYTERYMNTPQENPDGYNATSAVKAAAKLHGKLLLLHGLMDDNVHVQNTVQLVEELQKADKDFEVMIYPRARHGGFGKHFQLLMVDFMKRTLRPEP